MNSFWNSFSKIAGAYISSRLLRSIPGNALRIGIASTVVVGTIVWLAFSGYGANKSYFVTIAELGNMGDKAYHSQLRVEGFVVPGSIEHNGPHVDFVMNEFESHNPKAPSGRLLKITYKGSEPPPDTFKDDSQALADGSYGRDGVFHASVLQAKCASKYAPAGPNQPAGKPAAAAPPAKSAASSAAQPANPAS
jgi:cytochrome c-type biogenesis protein CcmE